MANQLLPCPFCNAQAVLRDEEGGGIVYCDHLFSCPLDGNEKLHASTNEWNTRAQPAASEPKPICPKCGGTGEADSGGVQPWGEPILIPCDYTHPAPAGVVLPERMVKTERSSDEYDMCADHWNACLDEVARLNGVKS